MKNVLRICLVCVLVCVFSFAAFADSEPMECRDSEQNVTFTVPAGWSRTSANEVELELSAIRYYFTNDENPLFCFYYVVSDEYMALDDSTRSRYSRSDIDNEIITAEQVKESLASGIEEGGSGLFTVNSPEIRTATVGGYSYYLFTANTSTYGVDGRIVVYTHIYNGYSLAFCAVSYSDDEDCEELLEDIVETVDFGNEKNSNAVLGGSSNKAQTKSEKASSDFSDALVRGAITGGVTGGAAALVGVLVGKNKKKKAAAAQAPTYPSGQYPNNPYSNGQNQSNPYAGGQFPNGNDQFPGNGAQ